ncbi:MAG: LamG-like jellyroll fold domain-containing protein [Solirubrobacterales bacterium]
MRKRAVCWAGLFLILGSAACVRAELIAHWKLDEKEGTAVKDATGNGYDGTATGNVTWIEGMVGGAIEVSGGGRVDFGNPADWPAGKSPRSLVGWGRPNTVASGYRWMAAYGTAGTGQAMFIGMNGAAIIAGGYNGDDVTVNNVWVVNEWTHVALTYDGTTAKVYANGVEVGSMAKNWSLVLNRAFLGEQVNAAGEYWNGSIDDVRLYNHVVTAAELPEIMAGLAEELALAPVPEDEATDVLQDQILSWTAGKAAATHDVYFGTTFADVNEAGRSDPRGVLVSQDQAGTEYDPDGLLDFGQTYYWRIDEVNGAPDYTVFKGQTWSFTAEPYSYPLTSVTATASAAQPGMGPENTVNGSGLNANDEHSTSSTDMWMTTGAMPVWIQYEFDNVYKLDEMWIWNSNQMIESFLGFGAKTVAIEYSEDGVTWTTLEGVPEFTKATGLATYTANTTIDFGGATAKFVKLTISANWGGVTTQTGLSEVRFFYAPVRAFSPDPAVDATGVSVETDLNWRPGRDVTSHKVYVGTDSAAVADGTAAAETVTSHSYTPAGLMLGTQYFWKVDEVGAGGTYAGDVWSFTTEEFAVVDDFESYDDEESRIYDTWVDGLTDGASGSQVGYNESPFAEKTIIHGGKQAMPLMYDNASFGFSQTTRQFDPPQDWSARGIKSLAVHFAGLTSNTGALYLKINNTKIVYNGDQSDLARNVWQAWNIDLSTVSGISSVRSLTIGIEGSGASGKLYVDDIRLYPKAPEYIVPVQPATTNLVGYYTFDEGSGTKVGDSSGKGHNGTTQGTPEWVAGKIGGAMNFGGDGDWVDLGNPADWPAGAEPRSMCAWLKTEDLTATFHFAVAYGSPATPQAMFLGLNGSGLYGGAYGDDLVVSNFWELGVWHHIALTYDGTTARLYADGIEVASAAKNWNLVRSLARIGQQVNEANEFWDGAVDDVRIYNKALSPEEVAGLSGQTTPRNKPF